MGNIRGNDEDSRADHRADHDHRRIEQAEPLYELRCEDCCRVLSWIRLVAPCRVPFAQDACTKICRTCSAIARIFARLLGRILRPTSSRESPRPNPRPRDKHSAARFQSDAADGDQRLIRQLPRRAQKFDPDNRVGIRFRGCRENRPYCNIIRRSAARLPQLLEVVCRNAHPAGRLANLSRVFHGQIVLADVDPAAPAIAAMSGRSLRIKRTPRGAEHESTHASVAQKRPAGAVLSRS